jgi:hypothetical protein
MSKFSNAEKTGTVGATLFLEKSSKVKNNPRFNRDLHT